MNRKKFAEQIKTGLRQAEKPTPCVLPPEHLLAAVRREAIQRKQHAPMPYRTFVLRQMSFIGWRVWTGQAILLAGMLLIFQSILRDVSLRLATAIPQLLFYLSLLVSTVMLPVLYRSVRYQMHELEVTAYYALPRLLMAKLLAVGLGDVAVLSGIALFTAARTAMSLGSATLYLLCPFLLASGAILHLLGHCQIAILLPASAGVYGVLIAGYGQLRCSFPQIFDQSFTVLWFILCIVLVLFCGMQLSQMASRSRFSERQIV